MQGGKCDDGHARTGNSYWAAVYSFQWDLASADINLTLNMRNPVTKSFEKTFSAI
jgi:hypothetical protein